MPREARRGPSSASGKASPNRTTSAPVRAISASTRSANAGVGHTNRLRSLTTSNPAVSSKASDPSHEGAITDTFSAGSARQTTRASAGCRRPEEGNRSSRRASWGYPPDRYPSRCQWPDVRGQTSVPDVPGHGRPQPRQLSRGGAATGSTHAGRTRERRRLRGALRVARDRRAGFRRRRLVARSRHRRR